MKKQYLYAVDGKTRAIIYDAELAKEFSAKFGVELKEIDPPSFAFSNSHGAFASHTSNEYQRQISYSRAPEDQHNTNMALCATAALLAAL